MFNPEIYKETAKKAISSLDNEALDRFCRNYVRAMKWWKTVRTGVTSDREISTLAKADRCASLLSRRGLMIDFDDRETQISRMILEVLYDLRGFIKETLKSRKSCSRAE